MQSTAAHAAARARHALGAVVRRVPAPPHEGEIPVRSTEHGCAACSASIPEHSPLSSSATLADREHARLAAPHVRTPARPHPRPGRSPLPLHMQERLPLQQPARRWNCTPAATTTTASPLVNRATAARGTGNDECRAKLVPLGACPRAAARSCILGKGMRCSRRFGSSSLDDPIRAPRTPRGPLGRQSRITARTQRISTQHTDLSAAAGRYRGNLGRPRAPRPLFRLCARVPPASEDVLCG